ncbi:head completion/stabilization protein [Pseudomonas fluorescens]|uniref:head completion/stabilization protein n=1 Tax=Pseudomonas fluorescens TaxID=294 RepID=UPI00113134C4|nr:head completion/stabilization protein [Pseudomonas fluorescens]TMU70528.1 head completion/stabilization protein [Pseudomonas fluorescens]
MSFSGNPTTFVEQTIENDGFWPNLSVSEFQKGYRLPAEFLGTLLVDALSIAMAEVNTDLAKLKSRWQILGIANVEAAEQSTPERALQVSLYKRAVYCRAKASALPQFASVTRRESAENTAKEAPELKETFLAFSQSAVRALQGRGRITAALL